RQRLPTLLVANKIDLGFDPADLEVLEELTGLALPSIPVSAETGEGLDRIAPFLFRELAIVRVYTKAPGKPPEMERPFTVRRGAEGGAGVGDRRRRRPRGRPGPRAVGPGRDRAAHAMARVDAPSPVDRPARATGPKPPRRPTALSARRHVERAADAQRPGQL